MRKAKENLIILYWALRYSLAFCFKHSKRDTVIRLVISGVGTFVVYLTIQSTGMVMNAVQHSHGNPQVLIWPITIVVIAKLIDLAAGRALSYFQQKWVHVLKSANTHDIDMRRGSLDIASFRSKRYDDLNNQIQELPQGWYTRVGFA